MGWVEVSALLTARVGGRLFSASNYWGATSGSLDETSFRPDTGLLIVGVDAVTGNANTQHVTTEDYYHALRAIPERWVYDANVIKLREAKISVTLPLRMVPGFRTQAIRAFVHWEKSHDVDESAEHRSGNGGERIRAFRALSSVSYRQRAVLGSKSR